MDSLYFWIVTSLIFSFFFSGIEIAFLSANRLQVELQGKQGLWAGKIMAFFMQNPSRFIGTTLIGNTLALVIFGNSMVTVFEPSWKPKSRRESSAAASATHPALTAMCW